MASPLDHEALHSAQASNDTMMAFQDAGIV